MLTLQVTHSRVDGWVWTIRLGAAVVDMGHAASRGECRREGESFLRWHRTRLATPRRGD